MISIKKQLIKSQLEGIFATYPIVIWYQSKQKTTGEWKQLKAKIKALELTSNSNFRVVRAKTSILKLILKAKTAHGVDLISCQGPLLISGCATPTDLQNILKLLNRANDGFVLGGYYAGTHHGQQCTWTEVEKLQTLGVHTYTQLLQSMQTVMVRLLFMKQMGNFSYMRRVDGALCAAMHQTLQQCTQNIGQK